MVHPFPIPARIVLAMDFYADNSIDEVYVNGVAQSPYLEGIPSGDPYGAYEFMSGGGLSVSLCNGWQPGLNVLIVKIASSSPYESVFLHKISDYFTTTK